MREKFYQMDELQKARALQDEAAKLHIPVPVLSYQYEIADADGNIEEKGIGKSNSYTRNALNHIARGAGLCGTNVCSGSVFGDGYVSAKFTTGTIADPFYLDTIMVAGNGVVQLGTATTAESLDNYVISASGLTVGTSSVTSVFNSTTRKMITTLSCSFKNNTASAINITESGIKRISVNNTNDVLFIRDVFTAIPVEPGKTITWTYVTEVAYPEP